MEMQHWPNDEDLLADLRAALEENPVTEQMRAAAITAYTWRTIDAELASLVHDSAVDPEPALRGPAPGRPRDIVFSHGDVALTLQLTPDGLLGQLAPPQTGEVTVQQRDGTEHHLSADDLGLFSMTAAPTQPFRLQVTSAAMRLVTDWVTP